MIPHVGNSCPLAGFWSSFVSDLPSWCVGVLV